MVRAHLRGDALARAGAGLEQRHFARGGEVKNVQTRAVALRQAHGHRRRSETRFHRADVRMLRNRNVVAVPRACSRFVRLNGRRVFAVRRDQQRRARENPFERGRVVDKHVAGGRAHEHLHAAGEHGIDGFHHFEVVVRRTEVEAVVREGYTRGARVFVAQRGVGDRLRIAVRHLHVAGDAAGDSRFRLGGDRAFVLEPRFSEMHLVVDHSRDQIRAVRVDLTCAGRRRDACGNGVDAAVADLEIAFGDVAFVDDARVLDDGDGHSGVLQMRCRILAR